MKRNDSFPVLVAILTLSWFSPARLASGPKEGSKAVKTPTPGGLSPEDWSAIKGANDTWKHRFTREDDGTWSARNTAQQWRTVFDGRGFLAEPSGQTWRWGLQLEEYGIGGSRKTIEGRTEIHATAVRLSYRWDENLEEWFLNDGRGLEQGWTLRERPAGETDERLCLDLAVRGDLRPSVDAEGQSVRFKSGDGNTTLTYGGLKAWDAEGRTLPTRFLSRTGGIAVEVDDREATYPVTIDPIAQQAYLKSDETAEADELGFSVAISGNTVVVGSPGQGGVEWFPGAALVFVRNGTTWTQQAILEASFRDDLDRFGYSVAISGDTIVVGAELEDSNATGVDAPLFGESGTQEDNSLSDSGAAYVFARDGTTWSQQAYLKASNPGANHRFGCSVGVSGDTVIVGAWGENSTNPGFRPGAAYVFTRTETPFETVWSQQALLKPLITVSDDNFGFSVAVSGDTAVIGAIGEGGGSAGVNGDQNDNSLSSSGAAYVFVRDGSTWTQQAYLKASNPGYLDQFGYFVAVSGDTAVVGAPFEDSNAVAFSGYGGDPSFTFNSGAAYVFVRSSGIWTQQDYLKASNTGGGDLFGGTVAISGNTVVVGAPAEDSDSNTVDGDAGDNSAADAGAAYLYVRSANIWFHKAYLKASNSRSSDYFGAVAVSEGTVAVGAFGEDSSATGVNGTPFFYNSPSAGAAYVFADVDDYPARLAAYQKKVAAQNALVARLKKQLKAAKKAALIRSLKKKLKAALAMQAWLRLHPPAR